MIDFSPEGFLLIVSDIYRITNASCSPQIRNIFQGVKKNSLTVSHMGIGSPVRINRCAMEPFEPLDGEIEVDCGFRVKTGKEDAKSHESVLWYGHTCSADWAKTPKTALELW